MTIKPHNRSEPRVPWTAASALLATVLTLLFAACVSEVGRGAPLSGATPPPATTALTPSGEAPTPTATETPELFLQVRAPTDGSTVPGSVVVVHGLTTRGAQVKVDGTSATVDRNGGFRAEAELSPGANTVTVLASDSTGSRKSVSLTVSSLALPPLPFLLLVTQPVNESVVFNSDLTLTGRTGPDAIASVNGVTVDVDPFGAFTTSIILEPGPNIIDVVATNNDGRVLSAVVAVIYRDAG